jgi:hypothetical protein
MYQMHDKATEQLWRWEKVGPLEEYLKHATRHLNLARHPNPPAVPHI